MRNPLVKQKEEVKPEPAVPTPSEPETPVQLVEREINLSLINDKLNYITGLLHKIIEAAEIDLEKK